MKRVRLLLSFASIVVVTALLLCCTASPAWAQTTTMGTITGLVTDQSGAVVPDVNVTITDKATKSVRNTTTNTAGRYVFVNVPPGTYDVTFTKAGFAKVSVPNDVIAVGEVSTNNVTLKVGSESQTVEVAASASSCRP